MENSRTSNSIKNTVTSMLVYIIIILIGFVSQAVFLDVLSVEYNGIKGLFNNILYMLNIVELGFGTAIVYNLYKPMAEKNIKEIKVLVKYYKRIYHIVAVVIFIIGTLLLPIIPILVGKVSIPENIRFLFFLYLLNTVFSYLLTYKRSILYADQKNYLTKIVNCFFVIIKNVLQIIILLTTRSFIMYLIIQIILTILENISINIIVNKKYDYIKNLKDSDEISSDVKQEILLKVKGLLFHKIGSFIVTGTDNIIISMSKNLGVVAVGMYSNYSMIISQVSSLFGNVITSLTASIGNLLVENDDKKSREIYKSMLLLNSWIYCFCASSIYCMIEPFIKIWIGEEYLLPKIVLIVLVINFYIQGLRKTSDTFKEAAGVFYVDRFVPLIEATINLVFSLIFVKLFGLAGVFLGTLTSTVVIYLYSFPKYLYKDVLKGSISEYFKLHIFHIIVTTIIFSITVFISSFIKIENVWIELIVNGIICLIVPNLLYLIVAIKRPEFKFYTEKISKIINKGAKI